MAARDHLRTVATIGALAVTAPAAAVATGVALVGSTLRPPPPPAVAERPRTVLLSGGKMTKSLALARAFHRAGHRVVLAEQAKYAWTGHRFSRAVDAFHVIPEPRDPGYAAALLRLVEQEGVDVYVPVCSPVSSLEDARAKELLADHCEVVHLDADELEAVDDKHEFARRAAELGLDVPETHRITDPQQVVDFDGWGERTWVLKSIAYDSVRRLDLTPLPRPTPQETAAFARSLPISPDNPWILQEFVEGTEYCTHATVRDGRVQVHCCCLSSPTQLNYAHVDHPGIEKWVQGFVGPQRLTGQVSLDLIEQSDGRVVAIECNPRTHSAITMLYDHPGVARAYLEDDAPLVVPTPESRPTYWLYQELWRALSHPRTAGEQVRVVLEGKDAVFDWSDPLPFFVLHHVQLPRLLALNLLARKGWLRIDVNIGKLVEPGGD